MSDILIDLEDSNVATDNRDLYSTKIHVGDQVIVVNPVQLFLNAVENAEHRDEWSDTFKHLIDVFYNGSAPIV